MIYKGGFMDNKELRKMNRRELLEIILAQTKRIEDLELEMKKVKGELNSKKIEIAEAGNIAEAALKLNKVFETAEIAAEQYRKAIKNKEDKDYQKMLKEYEKEKKRMLKKVESDCLKKKEEADNYIKDIEMKVKEMVEGNKELAKEIKIRKGKKKA